MQTEIQVYADRTNQINLYAVQGESSGRTYVFNIIEKDGTVIATSNADIIHKMLNLTGYSARLYIRKPDNTVSYIAGTILDAENGKISFTLTSQSVASAGQAECNLVLTSGNNELRIVGIFLTIDTSIVNENMIESEDEFTALQSALSTVSEYDTRIAATESGISNLTSRVQPITLGGTGATSKDTAWSNITNDSGWEAVTLNGNWDNYSDTNTLQMRSVRDMGFLRGAVKRQTALSGLPSNGDIIATIPANIAPSNNHYFNICISGGYLAQGCITKTGNVILNRIYDSSLMIDTDMQFYINEIYFMQHGAEAVR